MDPASFSVKHCKVQEVAVEEGQVMYRATVRVTLLASSLYKEATGYSSAQVDALGTNSARGQALDGAIQMATERAMASLSGSASSVPSQAPPANSVPIPKSPGRGNSLSLAQRKKHEQEVATRRAEEETARRAEEDAEEQRRMEQEEQERLAAQEAESAAAEAEAEAEAQAAAEAQAQAEAQAAEAAAAQAAEEAEAEAQAQAQAAEAAAAEAAAKVAAAEAAAKAEAAAEAERKKEEAAQRKKEEEATETTEARKSPRVMSRVAPRGSPAGAGGRKLPPGSGRPKQLSLSSRKNVKQFQPNFAEHAGRLQETLQLVMQIQSKVDWVVLAEKCDEGGHKFECGEIFYEKAMSGLADNLCQLADPGRDELANQWTSGGISLRFDPDQATEWSMNFPDGDLELVSRGEPWVETESIGADFVAQFSESGANASGNGSLKMVPAAVPEEDDGAVDDETGLPMVAARSLQQYDEAINSALVHQCQALALGYDIVLDVDYFEMLPMLGDHPGRLGAAWAAALEQLAAVIEDVVAADPEMQTKMAEVWTTAVLKVMNDDGLDVWMIDFVDGDLILISSSLVFEDVSTLGLDLGERVNEMMGL